MILRAANNGHVTVTRTSHGSAIVTIVKYGICGSTNQNEYKVVADYETASKGAVKSARNEAAKHGIFFPK